MAFEYAPAGVGMSVMLLIPILALVLGRWVIGTGPSPTSLALLVSAALFAVLLSVRSSPVLITWNVAGVILILPVAIYFYGGAPIRRLTLWDHSRIVIRGLIESVVHPVQMARHDMPGWSRSIRATMGRSRPVLRGAVVALILLGVFGALLASADAVFANLVGSVFEWDIEAGIVMGAAVIALGIAWVVIAVARMAADRTPLPETGRRPGYLGRAETIVMLAPLTALFAVFVAIQFTYLFGGVDTIAATGGLTRADYYRQGFFGMPEIASYLDEVTAQGDRA